MSRTVGTVFPDDGKPMRINQHMHAQPDGHYQIQDMDKKAEYEKRKAKFEKSKEKK